MGPNVALGPPKEPKSLSPDAFLGSTYTKIGFWPKLAGSPPRTPLGELTTLPFSPVGFESDEPMVAKTQRLLNRPTWQPVAGFSTRRPSTQHYGFLDLDGQFDSTKEPTLLPPDMISGLKICRKCFVGPGHRPETSLVEFTALPDFLARPTLWESACGPAPGTN